MKFRTRVALLFIAVIVIVQAIMVLTVSVSVWESTRHRSDERLADAGHALMQTVAARGERLSQAVGALAVLYDKDRLQALGGAAVAQSMLAQQQARMNAVNAVLLTTQGQVVARASAQPSSDFAFKALLVQARQHGSAHAVVARGKQALQVIIEPVSRDDTHTRWVMMSFSVGAVFIHRAAPVAGLNASVVVRREDGAVASVTSMLPASSKRHLAAVTINEAQINHVQQHTWDGQDWRVYAQPLSRDSRVLALLYMSSTAALAPFHDVFWRLVGLSLGTVVLFIICTIMLSAVVARPMLDLLKAARRVRRGDYAAAVPAHNGEFGRLSEAFNAMQRAISEREQRIEHQAYHDRLTGLANRNLLTQAIEDAMVEDSNGALLSININRFHDINDTLGYEVGDEVLKTVAQRLLAHTRASDVVARMGNDEFMVLLRGVNRVRALMVTSKLSQYISQPTMIDGMSLYIEPSIGVVLYPPHGRDAETLLRRVDMALADAKTQRAGEKVYRSGRDEQRQEQLAMISDFHNAVDNDELQVYYQPKVRLSDGKVTQVEALVRWVHPRWGLIEPADFVPLAEQSGNIRWLTEWMLRHVIAQLQQWSQAGVELSIAMNLSAYDLADSSLLQRVRVLLDQHGVAARSLIFEVTETVAMQDIQASIHVLHRMRQLGIRVAIDDFGTGYSSLAQLKRLPVDELKIDKTFVLGMTHDPHDAAIVRLAIELAHNCGMAVVAEGVETAQVYAALTAYQCDMAQGYLMSKPLSLEQFTAWFTHDREPKVVPS